MTTWKKGRTSKSIKNVQHLLMCDTMLMTMMMVMDVCSSTHDTRISAIAASGGARGEAEWSGLSRRE